MFEIGRVCMKIAGRDAGKYCVVVDQLDDKTVLIDGQTRRRKCNLLHIEPIDNIIKLPQDASHEKVVAVLKTAGIECKQPSQKQKQVTTRQKRIHAKKEKVLKEEPTKQT